MINLKIYTGKIDEAISLLKSRTFSIWEGSNAFNTGQAWADAFLIKGLGSFNKKNYREALADFQMALTPPENLRADGRITRRNQLTYWIGCAYAALGEKDKATQSWNEVVSSETQAKPATGERRRVVNLQEQSYFVALARKKLGAKDDVEAVFRKLSDLKTNMDANASANQDYQFISGRKLPSRENQAVPHYISGLGYSGLGDKTKAREEFNAALTISPDFLSAKIAIENL